MRDGCTGEWWWEVIVLGVRDYGGETASEIAPGRREGNTSGEGNREGDGSVVESEIRGRGGSTVDLEEELD